MPANILGTQKAWVVFAPGTVPVVNASYNVASVARLGTGNYQINYTLPMKTSISAIQVSGQQGAGNLVTAYVTTQNTTMCQIWTGTGSTPTAADLAFVSVQVINN